MLPKMWKEVQLLREDTDLRPPTAAEITYAMDVFAEHRDLKQKFCFIIDGMDELQGDYLEGIAFIRKLTANGRCKVVVSSRPIPECVLKLQGCPGLKLEALNRKDISKYVDDKIAQHGYMQRLSERHPEKTEALLQDLVEKSSAVFLWVILACRSLISGFADCDRLPELRRRVDELPLELHELFDHMMGKIKTRHREERAKLLRMFYVHTQRQRQQGVRTQNPASALSLVQVDDLDDEFDFYRTWAADEKSERCDEVAGRLRSRTGGLLELQVHKTRRERAVYEADAFVLDFMHRTVFEFLDLPDVWTLPSLRMANTDLTSMTLISVLKLHDCVRLLDHGGDRWHD